MSARSSSLDA